MPTYRVVRKVEYLEHYIVEAEDEEQAEAMASTEYVSPISSEAIPGSAETEEVEEIE